MRETVKMTLRFLLVFYCIVQLSLVCQAADRKRVAVMNFEFGAIQKWWSGNWDIGKGVSDLIVTELVTDGTFRVIERNRLDQILAEQNLGNSGRANPTTAAQIGKVLGVNGMIVGSITQFGTEKKKRGISGAFSKIGALGGGTYGTQKGKAKVVIDARIVDTVTGEILAVAKGTGESQRSGLMLGGYGGGSGGSGGGSVNMGSSDFRETILGEAVQYAVTELANKLIKSENKMPEVEIEIAGLIADVDGPTVILNIGSSEGLEAGTILKIKRVNRTVKDPATGRVLREISNLVGELRVNEVDNHSSVGTIVSGNKIKVGDKVTN